MTNRDLPVVGDELAEAAEALLAERLRVQGRPAGSYTTEEFLQATEDVEHGTDGEAVQASKSSPISSQQRRPSVPGRPRG